MTEKHPNNIIETLKSRLPSGGLLCVLCTAFSLCIFAPLEIYLSNISEFWFTLKLILPLFLLVCVVVIVLLFILEVGASLIGSSVAVSLTIVIAMLSIATYIQGNYLMIGDSATLNGAAIDWNNWSGAGLLSNMFWLVIVIAIVLMIAKWHGSHRVVKVLSYVTGCIALVEIVTLVILFISCGNSLDKSEYFATSDDEMTFAEDDNTLIIVLDAFVSDGIDLLLADDDTRVEQVLEDFTFYPDTMTVFGGTMLSVPQILTGRAYDDEQDFETYLNEAYESSPLLNRAIDAENSIGLYTTCEMPTSREVMEHVVNAADGSDCHLSSKKSFIVNYYRVVAYRYAPYVLKKILWFYPDVFDYMKRSDKEGDAFDWNNGVFHNAIDDVNIDESLTGSLKLIHIKGFHGTWCTLADGTDDLDNQVTDEIEVLRGNLSNLDKLFAALKKQNIYNDMTIVILADHGAYMSEDRQFLQNPLLMIKGSKESHDFAISNAPVSYADMQQIFEALQKGMCAEDAVKSVSNSSGRYYYYFDQTVEGDQGTYIENITEYYTDGKARDWEALKETGVVLHPDSSE